VPQPTPLPCQSKPTKGVLEPQLQQPTQLPTGTQLTSSQMQDFFQQATERASWLRFIAPFLSFSPQVQCFLHHNHPTYSSTDTTLSNYNQNWWLHALPTEHSLGPMEIPDWHLVRLAGPHKFDFLPTENRYHSN